MVVLNLAMLYASKLGAILVGLLILPQFNHLLGPQQFGVAAVIMSIQALLLMMDFGMSILVGRDVAAHSADPAQAAHSWRTSGTVLTLVYLALTPVASIVNAVFNSPLAPLEVLACMVLFWSLTLQNVGHTALLAARRFGAASTLQLLGVLARALATWAALVLYSPDLGTFLKVQAVFALLQWWATQTTCSRLFRDVAAPALGAREHAAQALAMARRGGPLVLFGVAGAAVMQLDKPLVSALTSAAQTAPYFLATVLCLTPVSALAGPVAQFYHPRLIQAMATGNDDAVQRCLKPFTTVLVLITFVPCALLWLLREPIIGAWLGPVSGSSAQVAHYTGILLPGAAVGAIGYLPFTMLVARQDFRFQAVASSAMTLLTLVAAAFVAQHGSVEGVCWVYVGYHCLSTIVSWLRCAYLDRGRVRHANAAGLRAAALVAAICAPALTIAFSFHLI
jgi:O-antigen/teichoic acid export membrane protein